jgi:hypothetical protein
VLRLAVTVVFQGSFGERGYRFGRVAASLSRLSGEGEGEGDPPLNIGREGGYAMLCYTDLAAILAGVG